MESLQEGPGAPGASPALAIALPKLDFEVADAHADVEKIWGEIQLKPGSFVDFLTQVRFRLRPAAELFPWLEMLEQVLGFDRAYRWAFVDHMQESFQRMLYFFWKLVADYMTRRSL